MSKRNQRKRQPRMPKRPPAYVPKLLAQAAPLLEPGTVINWMVRHDDWCRHWRGGSCNCNPDVEMIGHAGPYGSASGRN